MAFTPKHGTGRVFDREADNTSPKQPKYTGTVNWQGQVLRVAMWYNPPSERSRVASFSVRLEDDEEYRQKKRNTDQDVGRAQPGGKPEQHDFDDDIPF